MPSFLRLTLVTGETRHVALGEGDAADALVRFESARPPYAEEWIDTTEFTAVARAHVVEVQVVDHAD